MTVASDAVLDREAATVVFDEWGRPTDVDDTSALVFDGLTLLPRAEGVSHPLSATPTGAQLGALIEIVDTDTSPDSALIDLVAACERQKAWLEARAAAATAELTARCARLRGVGPRADQVAPEVLAAAELGPALRQSPVAAGMRVWLAHALQTHPATRAALTSGRIDAAKARALLRGIDHLDPDTAGLVEARVLARAGEQTLPAMTAALRRAVLAADPAGAQRRHEHARAGRGVWRDPIEDGMSRLEWVAPAEQVEATHTWLTEQARAAQRADREAGGAARTLDQARSDVLADLGVRGLLGTRAVPGATGSARADVVVHLSTLLGEDDLPGQIPGVGPVTAEVARQIAGDATWRRLLTDPVTGVLTDLGTQSYVPPQAMRDAVLTRDRTCRFLGCRMPAVRCDLDHTLEWPCGPTCPANLVCLCRTHHRIKTLTDTTYRSDGFGGHLWTMPSGKTWHQPPEPVLDEPPTPTHADLDPPPF